MASVNARRLRKNPTDAEKRLWRYLRDKQLGGHRFRRQQPIGPYIVDFFCPQIGVVIEIDGGQHSPETDDNRTRWLEAGGYRVIRFWNNDVLGNPEGVWSALAAMLREYPPPRPSPSRGEGEKTETDK
jgi:adenine-specific DNA-methyltransferase